MKKGIKDKILWLSTTIIGVLIPLVGLLIMYKSDKLGGLDMFWLSLCSLIFIYIKDGEAITEMFEKFIDNKEE